ncbi:MAG: DMT family transporter [Gemmatimonadaceae bacterium]
MASLVTTSSVRPHDRAGAQRRAALATEALLLLMVLIWGVNFSVVKFGTSVLAPLAYNGLRVALAAVGLWAIALATSNHWPSRRDALALVGLGFIGNGVYQLLFIEGIARTRAGSAALVIATSPAVIAILGKVRGSERIDRRGWGGIGLQLLGVACVVLGGAADAAAPGERPAFGALLLLGGTVCWSVFSVALKPYTHRVDALQLSALTMTGGALPLVAVAAPAMLAADWGRVGPAGWSAVLYSGFLALVVAYLIWYRGVRVLGPTRTAMFGNLQPVVALSVAWIALGEVPTVWQVVGTAAIMSGLFLARGGGAA